MAPSTSDLVLLSVVFFTIIAILGILVWSLVTSANRKLISPDDPNALEASQPVPDVSAERSVFCPEPQEPTRNKSLLRFPSRVARRMLATMSAKAPPILPTAGATGPLSQMSQHRDDFTEYPMSIPNPDMGYTNLLSEIQAESSIDLKRLRRHGRILHAMTQESDEVAELNRSSSGIGLGLFINNTESLPTSGVLRPTLELMNADMVNDDDLSKDQRLETSSTIAPSISPVTTSVMSTNTLPTLVFTSPSFRSTPIGGHNSEKYTFTPPSLTLTMPSIHCGLDSAVTDYVDKIGDMAGVGSELDLWSHVLASDDYCDDEYFFPDDASLRLLDDFPSPPQEHCSGCMLSIAYDDVDPLQRKMSHRKRAPMLLETDGLSDEDILENTFDYAGFYERLAAFRRQSEDYGTAAINPHAMKSSISEGLTPLSSMSMEFDYSRLLARKRPSPVMYDTPRTNLDRSPDLLFCPYPHS